MGGPDVAAGNDILDRAGIPTFPYPDDAARIFNLLWRYDANIRGMYETPKLLPTDRTIDRARAGALVASALAADRTLLTEAESKELLEAYGFPIVRTSVATSAEMAVAAALKLGFPVAVKVHSKLVTHKTDVGGVRLNVNDAQEVERAYAQIEKDVSARAGTDAFLGVTVQPMIETAEGYELIFGSSVDAQFGPVLLFGLGGQLVEIFPDHTLALPPLTLTLARHAIERTHIAKALAGVRGRRPIDLDALAQAFVRFGTLVVEQPRVREIEINPLLATPDRIVALDARVVLRAPGVLDGALPVSAIRPYPSQYEGVWRAPSGSRFSIRPIVAEDEQLMREFHEALSAQSVYLRYAQALRLSERVAHEHLARLCFIDYDREIALVATDDSNGASKIVAVARLIKERVADRAEFALVVGDAYQHHGLGTELLRRLIEIGRNERLGSIAGYILAENTTMLEICRRLGFQLDGMGGEMRFAVRDLTAPEQAPAQHD